MAVVHSDSEPFQEEAEVAAKGTVTKAEPSDQAASAPETEPEMELESAPIPTVASAGDSDDHQSADDDEEEEEEEEEEELGPTMPTPFDDATLPLDTTVEQYLKKVRRSTYSATVNLLRMV
jgi:hypothetical protein